MNRGIKVPPKNELLAWINEKLDENYPNFPKPQKVEALGTGVAFCYIFNLMFPGAINLAKLNHKSTTEQ